MGTKKRAMRVVPRVVFGVMAVGAVGVVPAVALSCGDEPGCKGAGCSQVTNPPGVAAVGYACFDANDPNCAHQPPPPPGVAAVGYACFDGSTDPNCNFGVADSGFKDTGSDVEAG